MFLYTVPDVRICEIIMKKVISFFVVGGLCISSACFGMDSVQDSMNNNACFVSPTTKTQVESVKINSPVNKKSSIENNRKVLRALGASALLIGGGILAYRKMPLVKSFAKSLTRHLRMEKKSTITCTTYNWTPWSKPVVKCFDKPSTWSETWTNVKMSLSVLTYSCPFLLSFFGVMTTSLYGASYLKLLPLTMV